MVKIGFIGFGEAAFNIANGLQQEGLGGIIAYDKFWNALPNSELINRRAKESGVVLVPNLEELVKERLIEKENQKFGSFWRLVD